MLIVAAAVWVAVLAGALTLLASAGATWLWWVVAALAAAAAVYLMTCVRTVRPGRKANIERRGGFHRTVGAGTYWLVPVIDRMQPPIDMREQEMGVRADVITRDNVDTRTDTAVFFRVRDAYKASYQVRDYPRMIEKITATVLRNAVASKDLDDFLRSRLETSTEVCTAVSAITGAWGIEVTRVEITVVEMPEAIRDAMEHREGAILRAQGDTNAIRQLGDAIRDVPEAYRKFVVDEYFRCGFGSVREADGKRPPWLTAGR